MSYADYEKKIWIAYFRNLVTITTYTPGAMQLLLRVRK